MTTLVLLPGLAGDEAMWRPQLQALALWQPRVSDVHMRHADIPAMAAALLDETTGPLVLCGASMGGMIAMEAARRAPVRIAGLGLLGTTARPESDEMRAMRESAIRLFEQGRVREVIEPNVQFAFHPRCAGDTGLTSAYLEFVLRAGAVQLVRQNRAVIGRPDARPFLSQLRCPVLVVAGEDDVFTPPDHAREIAALAPRSELVLVPCCGHMLTMEQPDAVNAALAGWLARLAAEPAPG